jgi:hypothetical protein
MIYSFVKHLWSILCEPITISLSAQIQIESTETPPSPMAHLTDEQRASLLTWAGPAAA